MESVISDESRGLCTGAYKVPYSAPLGGGGGCEVCWGRISSCEEGKGISLLWGKINVAKRERGRNNIFPMIPATTNVRRLRLLGRISSGDEKKGGLNLGKKIKILKNGGSGRISSYRELYTPLALCAAQQL